MVTVYDLTIEDTIDERLATMEDNLAEVESFIYYSSGYHAGVVWREL